MSTFLVSPRSNTGEKPKHLRKKGLVPMVVIDRQHEAHPVKASVHALRDAVHGADSHGVIELQIEGESGTRKAMLKSLDGDALARTVLCATFQEVSDDDRVKADVPVMATGHVPASADGENPLLTAVTAVLHIRGKVSDLPDHIEVDVSNLEIGQHVSAGDVALPSGIELLSSTDAILFTVSRVPAPVLEEEMSEDAESETKIDTGGVTAEA